MPSFFTAFKIKAAEAPNRLDVFPVIMEPSGSSIAAAGAPIASERSQAAGTERRISQ